MRFLHFRKCLLLFWSYFYLLNAENDENCQYSEIDCYKEKTEINTEITTDSSQTKITDALDTLTETTEMIVTTEMIETTTPTPKKGLFSGLIMNKAKSLFNKAKTGDLDVKLMAFKGMKGSDQSEEEQMETDGFFNQFKNSLGRACFKDLGCFSAGEYNDFVSRPIPVLPLSPEVIKLQFHLYTLEARTIPRNFTYRATSSQFKYSTFDPNLRTAFIVHGYHSGYALWMENLKDFIQYLSKDQFNVIIVDWEKGAKSIGYNSAAANTRVVGACVAFFVDTICKTFNITNDKFHLIGHGLGAHVVGYAGKRLVDPKVGRITALDPAGIGFHFPNPAMRLDSTDASIVDVIHTDCTAFYTDGFGTNDLLGHYDFFVNGGAWQPGCSESEGVAAKLNSLGNGDEITCSHSRATYLPYDLNKPEDECTVVAYQCHNYEMFLEGKCASCRDDKCKLLGINPSYWLTQTTSNKTVNKRYFVNTSHKEEFCLYHYQFALHVSADSDSTTGVLIFNLKAKISANVTKEITFQRLMTKTYQKKLHTFLINFDFPIEKIYALDLQWNRYVPPEKYHYRVNRGYKLKIPYIEINYMSSIDEKVRERRSSALCSDNEKIIVNKYIKKFTECNPGVPKDKALDTEPDAMIALEWKEDIYAVDYSQQHRVYHKIVGTRIKEKIKKYEIVD